MFKSFVFLAMVLAISCTTENTTSLVNSNDTLIADTAMSSNDTLIADTACHHEDHDTVFVDTTYIDTAVVDTVIDSNVVAFEVFEWGVASAKSGSSNFSLKNKYSRLSDMSVKKPVVYFYSDEKLEDVSLSVDIKGGTPTVLIPKADVSGENLTWDNITVYPNREVHIPTVFNTSVSPDLMPTLYAYNEFQVLLNNSGSYMEVDGDTTNFLFYEGDMTIENRISISDFDTAGKAISLENSGTYPVTNVYYTFIENINDTNFYYVAEFSKIAPGKIESVDFKYMGKGYSNHGFYRTNEVYTPSLKDMMKKEGFKSSEAEVFESYWRAEFFSEVPKLSGTYTTTGLVNGSYSSLTYMLDQREVEAILPMTISHTPTKLKRAIFVQIVD